MKTTHLLDRTDVPGLRTIGFSAQLFRGYENSSPDFHDHDVVELFLVLKGEGRHILKEEELPLIPGDLGIIHYGQMHSIVTSTPMDIINVYIDPTKFSLPPISQPLAAVLPRILPLAPQLGHNLNRVLQYNMSPGSKVEELLLALYDESIRREPGYLEAMKYYLRLFLIYCSRHAMESMENQDLEVSGAEAAVERLRRQLDDGWKEAFDLDALAQKARMSKAHLCRIFKFHTGRTILEYIHQRRIEQAMILLDSTNQKIITIASECGFGDLAHFNRIFKRLVGMTPSEFRKRN